MQKIQISGYKFIPLTHLEMLRSEFIDVCQQLNLLGTILLSMEGININLVGGKENIDKFLNYLKENSHFSDIAFHKNSTPITSFKHLKVKIKKEIITFNHELNGAICQRAPTLSPLQLKQWLDEDKDFILLDTRNEYEFNMGSFKKAVHLNIQNFTEFPQSAANLSKIKPIVMFCTGGIRCEKAALFLLQNEFLEVYQLDGGILGYFAQCGNAHYVGECFVFDNRIAVSG